MISLSHRRAKRFVTALGAFEFLTILIIICYVYYIGSLVSGGEDVKMSTERIPPLFSISKRLYTYSTFTTKLPPPTVQKKCPVAIVVILCEDDRYLTITKSNATKLNATKVNPPRMASTTPIAKDFLRQINQTLVLLKSIAILSKYDVQSRLSSCVEILLLSDKPQHYKQIKNEMEKWSQEFQQLVRLTSFPVRYPPGSAWMKKMFRPCATLRLFLAELIPANVWDSVIYLDTDIIFLQSVQALWGQFERFGDDYSSNENHQGPGGGDDLFSNKMAAMAPCLFHYGSSSNVVPYFGNSGLNAGIMLMNLTRMRGSQWTNRIRMVTTMFQDKIKLADQDILNIYFHFFPEELHVLTCDWNFRPFQCREGSTCDDPEISQGISALHGNALSFTAQGPEPLFRAVFQHFHKTKLDSGFNLARFVKELESSLLKAEENTLKHNSQCKQFGGFDVLLLNRLYSLVE